MPEQSPVVFSSPSVKYGVAGMGLLFEAIIVPTIVSVPIGSKIFLSVFGVLGAVLIVRALQSSVSLEPAQITLRGLYYTRRILLTELRDVAVVEQPVGFYRRETLRFVLSDRSIDFKEFSCSAKSGANSSTVQAAADVLRSGAVR